MSSDVPGSRTRTASVTAASRLGGTTTPSVPSSLSSSAAASATVSSRSPSARTDHGRSPVERTARPGVVPTPTSSATAMISAGVR
jgi:hypothetical protein